MSELACQGCGAALAADSPEIYRCPNAGRDAGDHVVGRTLDAGRLRLPLEGPVNPFERYRAFTHAYSLALSRGMTDDEFVALVRRLDDAVRAVDGHGFAVTPFLRSAGLSDALLLQLPGGVWVKDETRNVSGSHKGRHLMGLAILGEVQARLGILPARGTRLAIASCGNAALAAAVIARAWKRPLDVFIPEDANARVVAQLEEHGATVHVCVRQEGVAGDPCYHAFREAVTGGAVPFCCQGSDHGLTVEGGETLGWELVSDLLAHGRTLDRLFVQVGGGALASACVQAFRDATRVGAAIRMPKLHAVQTDGAHPLHRAWARVKARADSTSVEEALAYAAQHRAEFMCAWETAPKSVAHGILDDETYDWLAIVRGMLESGGYPILVSEERLIEANALGRAQTGIDVDPTGSSGLAGVLELSAAGALRPGESIGVLFTGVRR
jgi:threonine synthase